MFFVLFIMLILMGFSGWGFVLLYGLGEKHGHWNIFFFALLIFIIFRLLT